MLPDIGFWERIFQEASTVLDAPIAFFTLLTVGIAGAAKLVHWVLSMRYQGKIDTLEAQLKRDLPQEQQDPVPAEIDEETLRLYREDIARLVDTARNRAEETKDALMRAAVWEFRYLEEFLIAGTVAMLHWLGKHREAVPSGDFHDAWRPSTPVVEETYRKVGSLGPPSARGV